MAQTAIEFEGVFDEPLIESAAKSLVHQSLKQWLTWKLYGAGAVNLMAFIVIFFLLGNSPATWGIGVLAFLPLYYVAILALRPRRLSDVLRKRYKPSAHFSITSDSFTISANDRVSTMPWRDVKEVVEYREYFLLMLSRLGGIVVPMNGMPQTAKQLIRKVASTHHILSNAQQLPQHF